MFYNAGYVDRNAYFFIIKNKKLFKFDNNTKY